MRYPYLVLCDQQKKGRIEKKGYHREGEKQHHQQCHLPAPYVTINHGQSLSNMVLSVKSVNLLCTKQVKWGCGARYRSGNNETCGRENDTPLSRTQCKIAKLNTYLREFMKQKQPTNDAMRKALEWVHSNQACFSLGDDTLVCNSDPTIESHPSGSAQRRSPSKTKDVASKKTQGSTTKKMATKKKNTAPPPPRHTAPNHTRA